MSGDLEHALDPPGRPIAHIRRADGTGIDVVDLGRRAYGPVHEAMRTTHREVAKGERNGVVWLVEHDPVFTAGRATDDADIRQAGAQAIERGGRITYHGPGQLVVYPVVRLPRRDVRAWLKGLEAFGCGLCAHFGLDAEPSVDGTGVFVDGRKVGSIGVAISRWTNLHGLSLNLDMDLEPFHRVRPCGLDPEIMSDLSRALGRSVGWDEAVEAALAGLPALLDGAATLRDGGGSLP